MKRNHEKTDAGILDSRDYGNMILAWAEENDTSKVTRRISSGEQGLTSRVIGVFDMMRIRNDQAQSLADEYEEKDAASRASVSS